MRLVSGQFRAIALFPFAKATNTNRSIRLAILYLHILPLIVNGDDVSSSHGQQVDFYVHNSHVYRSTQARKFHDKLKVFAVGRDYSLLFAFARHYPATIIMVMVMDVIAASIHSICCSDLVSTKAKIVLTKVTG